MNTKVHPRIEALEDITTEEKREIFAQAHAAFARRQRMRHASFILIYSLAVGVAVYVSRSFGSTIGILVTIGFSVAAVIVLKALWARSFEKHIEQAIQIRLHSKA